MSYTTAGQSVHAGDTGRPSERVVRAVAAAEGVDPVALSVPLFEAIDPDALDALFATPRASGRVSFAYCGYLVTVTANGEVDLRESAADR